MPRYTLILIAALAVAVAVVAAFAMRGVNGTPALPRRAAVAATPIARNLSVQLRRCDAVLARTSGPVLASAPLTLTAHGDAIALTQTVRVAGWGSSEEVLAVIAAPGAAEEQVAFVTVATAEVRPIARRFAIALLPQMTPDLLSVFIPEASGGPDAAQFNIVDRRGARRSGTTTVSSPVLDAVVISRSSGAAVTISLADHGLVYDLASTDPIERETSGAARAVAPRPGTDTMSFVLSDRIVHDGCEAPFPAGVFYRAAWSADGRYLAVLARIGETLPSQSALLVWDTETGIVREAMRGAGVTITGLIWHPRVNTLLLSAAALESPEREQLWQFNPPTGSAAVALDTPLFAPAYWGIAFDPEGGRLAVGCAVPDATNGIVARGAICLFNATLP